MFDITGLSCGVDVNLYSVFPFHLVRNNYQTFYRNEKPYVKNRSIICILKLFYICCYAILSTVSYTTSNILYRNNDVFIKTL